jgi:hypothetical protein
MMLAPAFLKGDADRDGRLSREEFRALAAVWFASWDKQKEGALSEAQLRLGLNGSLQMPGGPGGRGSERGPGMGMQGQNGHNGMSAMMGIEFEWLCSG